MGSGASNPLHMVRGRVADRARLRLTSRKNDEVAKLQKKAPKALKSLDAELKSAPVGREASRATDGRASASPLLTQTKRIGRRKEREIFLAAKP